MLTLGEFIRDRRRNRKMNQTELSDGVMDQGTTCAQTTVSGWERGEGRPTLDQWVAVCRVLRLTVEDQAAGQTLILPPNETPMEAPHGHD